MRPSYRGRAGAGAGSGKIINLVDDISGGRMSHLMCTCFSPFVCLLQAQSTMGPRPSYFSRLWPSLCNVSTLPFRYPTSAYNVTPTSGENSPPQAVACIRSDRANLTAVCNCCTREFSPTLTISQRLKRKALPTLYLLSLQICISNPSHCCAYPFRFLSVVCILPLCLRSTELAKRQRIRPWDSEWSNSRIHSALSWTLWLCISAEYNTSMYLIIVPLL